MEALKRINKSSIALFVALLFNVSGLIGITFTPYKNWFIQNTPLNLCIMFALVIWVQEKKNSTFFAFVFTCFFTGMIAEATGVHTGRLFGFYSYGSVLGYKMLQVPVLIGVNWFLVIYGAAMIMQRMDDWMKRKYEDAGIKMAPWLSILSFVMDAALLTTFFDWLMEPVAVKLGYWRWDNDVIPLYNYLCWYFISVVLLTVFRMMRFHKHNLFAVHLFIIQALFFLALRTFL